MGATISATAPGPTTSIRQITPKEAQPRSRFHDLPAEVRVMIYRLVVVSPTPLPARVLLRDVEETTNSSKPEESTTFTTQYKVTPGQPAIARTDRTIRDEVLRVFYAENTFLFRIHALDTNPVRTWLEATSKRIKGYTTMVQSIHRVTLERNKPCTMVTHSTVKHLYRIAIKQHVLDEKLSVRLEEDMAIFCACAIKACASMKERGTCCTYFAYDQDNFSDAMEFAADIEGDGCPDLSGVDTPCKFGLCDTEGRTTCSECGLLVNKTDRRQIGSQLLWMYQGIRDRRMKRAMERESEEGGLFKRLRVANE